MVVADVAEVAVSCLSGIQWEARQVLVLRLYSRLPACCLDSDVPRLHCLCRCRCLLQSLEVDSE